MPIQGKYHSKWAKYSLKIGEIELIYARSAFKMFSKHKSMPGALHERSLPRGSLTQLMMCSLRCLFSMQGKPVSESKLQLCDHG